MNLKNAERLKKLDKIWEFKKYTVVLDMDGTLIYATKVRKQVVPQSIKTEKLIIDIIGEKRSNVYVYQRPHLEEFLSKMGEHFNLVLFTATEQYIADLIIDHVDAWKVIQHRYAKNYCDNFDGVASKNLKKLFPAGLKDVIMIEDAPGTCLQVDNAIRIKRWEADTENDTVLIDIADFLIENIQKVNNCKDLVDLYNKSQLEKDIKNTAPVQMDGMKDLEEDTGREDTIQELADDLGFMSPNEHENNHMESSQTEEEIISSMPYSLEKPSHLSFNHILVQPPAQN